MSKQKVRYIVGVAILVLAVVLVLVFCGKHSKDAEQSYPSKKDDVIENEVKKDEESQKDEEKKEDNAGLQVKEDETEGSASVDFEDFISDDEKKDNTTNKKDDPNVKEDTEQKYGPLF